MKPKHLKKASEGVKTFLEAWRKKDWGEMYKSTTETWAEDKNVIGPSILENWFMTDLKGFRIISSKQVGNAAVDFIVAVEVENEPERIDKLRVICEAAPYRPTLMGRWGVNPISALRLNKLEK